MKKIPKIILLIMILIAIIFLIRTLNPREIDDVSPERNCEQEYLQKSETLWVIPILNNKSIAENKTWCNEILAMNKTLGLHGITHIYHEFKINSISQVELNFGIQEFEKCFNQTPTMFKPPHLKINNENKILIKKSNLKLKSVTNQFTHKVYHCNNSGIFGNKFINVF